MARNLFGATQVRTVVHIVADSPTPLTALAVARGERPAGAARTQPVRRHALIALTKAAASSTWVDQRNWPTGFTQSSR